MIHRPVFILAVAGSLAFVVGCDHPSGVLDGYPAGTLETSSDLKYWSSASAPNVFILANTPLSLVALATASDGGCPIKSTSGTVDTYQGGCTDSSGVTWAGSMTVDNGAPDAGNGSIRYSDFQLQQSETCGSGQVLTSSTFRGTFTQTTSGAQTTFKVDLRLDGKGFDAGTCASTLSTAAIDYTGQQNTTTNVWSGQGRVGYSDRGVVSAETVDELLGDACATEAETGRTTIHAGANTAVITYDGASKCDSPPAVTWTLNGTDLGEVSGIACASAPGAAVSPAAGLWALAIALALWWRQRRPHPVRTRKR